MSTDNKISDSKPRRQGFQPIGVAAVAVRETLRERLLRAVSEDRAEFLTADEDAMTDPYVMPLAIELLSQNRWDDAVDAAWDATKRLLGDQPVLSNRIELMLLGSGPLDEDVARAEWQALVAEIAGHLEERGMVEHAIAWRMLQADPQKSWTFWRFMPQLDQLLSSAPDDDMDVAQARHRIVSWRRAAGGDFVTRDVSIFRIAHVELDSAMQPIDEDVDLTAHPVDPVNTLAERARDRAQEEAIKHPGIIAIPMARATKIADREGHAGFRDLIGKHLLHVLAPDLAEVRSTLRAEYPHASSVIDMLLRDLREGRPAIMKPMLIVGEPGDGKSRIVRRLGELLGMHVHRYDASGSADNMFAGMSKGWSGTQPAVPVRGLAMAKSGTFIMMVDELEKAATRTHAGNLWMALGPFLEKETSSRFRDPSLDAEVDLSWVSHIATGNDIDALPQFLRDRYRVVRWPMPTLDHLPALAANVLREIERETGEEGFNAPLEEDELEVIGRVWKRERFSMRKLQKLVAATLDARAAIAPRH